MTNFSSYKTPEIWYNDTSNSDLWYNETGLMLNTAALEERDFYFDIRRLSEKAIPPKATVLHSFVSL